MPFQKGSNEHTHKLGFIPIVVFPVLILIGAILDPHGDYLFNPPNLIFIFNVIFVTGTALVVAGISAKSYLKNGQVNVLLLGSAVLTAGLASLIGGYSVNISANYGVTIHNVGMLASSALQVLSALVTIRYLKLESTQRVKGQLIIAYSFATIFMVILTMITFSNLSPAFFPASGPTLIRQFVLGIDIFLFSITCLIFFYEYSRSKSKILFWYSLGLALFAIGLFGVVFQVRSADLSSWIGRLAQYTGGFYFVIALLSLRKVEQGVTLSERWADTFRTSRAQFAALFSNMIDAFVYGKIEVDKDGKPIDWVFLDVNDSYARVAGITREQIVGKRVSELFPEEHDDPIDWIGKYGRVALTGEPVHFEGYRKSFKKWLHVSAYSPKKGYFIVLFEDITKRKKAEEALAQSEEKYREIVETTQEGILVTDLDGKITFANSRIADLLGYTVGELVGKPGLDLAVESEKAAAQERMEKRQEGVKEQYEIWMRRKDGGKVCFLASGSPIRNSQGVHIGNLGMYVDITERKKVEEIIKQSEEKYRQLFSSMTEMFQVIELIFDKDGKAIDYYYREVNPAFEKLVGKTREQLDNKRAKAVFGIVEDYWLEAYSKVAKTGSPTHFENYGAELDKWYEVYAWKANEKQVAITFTDITERKQAEEKLSEYQENLEKLVEERTKQLKDSERLAAIGATAGMVGHDIRNPLQAITSDVYLIKTELSTTPESNEKNNSLESLTENEKNIDYINKIVADLQDYARPLKPTVKGTDLEFLVTQILLKSAIPKNIKTQYKAEKEAKEVMADPDLLKRVISNLVLNAVQAMPKGGKLSIYAYRQEGGLVIEVQDTGEGIPEDVKTKLFTPMFTTKSKGQGFGLVVVKRVTEAMNGTVSFESEHGKGTKFIIRLPPPKS